MSGFGRIIAGGIVGVVLAGCSASTATTHASAAATTPAAASSPAASSPAASSPAASSPTASLTRGWQATGDVDGDGRADRAQLLYLGGNGTGNWELLVDMTTLGQQAVRFSGDPVLPGNTAAPTIAGSADASGDGHAEIFVKVTSGASTQFWTIFKLTARQIRQVTVQGQPVLLGVNGTATHQDGFRCDGTQFVTVSESTQPPGYTTWTYKRDTYTWSGAELTLVSKRTGQVTSAQPGSPPAAYSGVSCGNLPQYAPSRMP